MKIDFTPAVFLFIAGLPLALCLLWFGWRHRRQPGAVPFLFLIGLSTAWSVGAALELIAGGLDNKLLWADLQYLPICFVPVAWLALALDYTGNRAWLTRRNLGLLSIVPLVMVGLQWTNSHHHLMRASAWLDTTGAHAVIGRTFGPAFWLLVAYCYIIILTAMAFLVHALLSRPRLYRRQPAVLLAGFAVPFIWNVVYLLKPGAAPGFDYTPAVFTLGEIIAAYGLFRLHVFSLVVVARDALMENMADGLLVLDRSGVVVDLNEAACSLVGLPSARIIGSPIAEAWEAWAQLDEPCRTGAEVARLSVGGADERRDYEVRMSDLDENGSFRGHMLVLRDVTERSALEEDLRRQALTDSLTGLANRSLFMAKLDDIIHTARRHPQRLFAIVVLDVDHFKFINDSVGHAAGDAVLEAVAIRLKRCVREVDTVARVGGDEFCVLLSEITDLRDVVVILERMQDEMREPVYVRQQRMVVGTSMGVVLWEASYRDPEDLLHAADAAMYQAKQAGGACYRVFDEGMHRALIESLRAEAELRLAVEKGDFELKYQPVIDVSTGKVVSLEALLRWKHASRGSISPNAFINVAETSGLIVPLGHMILDEVCGQLSEWHSRTSPAFGLPVSVNISPRQLTEIEFVEGILSRIAEWRLAPGSLMFEITETALDRDPVRARNAIKELCRLGMRLCLDDFGKGPSSLQHLTTFAGQEIKLDRTLIAKVADGTPELAIARSITELAHALELTVTAEGVESREDWQLLKQLGCDRMQGFYCGGPMSPTELYDHLREWRPAPPRMRVLERPERAEQRP